MRSNLNGNGQLIRFPDSDGRLAGSAERDIDGSWETDQRGTAEDVVLDLLEMVVRRVIWKNPYEAVEPLKKVTERSRRDFYSKKSPR